MQRNVGGGRQKAYKKCRCSPRQTRAAAAKGTKISRLKGDAATAVAAAAEENCQASCLCWLLSLTWLQINEKTQQSTGSAAKAAAAASWGILIFHTFPRRVLPRGVAAAATSTAAATWQRCHFAWQKVFPAPWELHEYQISRQSVNFKAHAA